MNWMELLSSLVDSLVWPAAVLWIIYILRKPIGDLLGKLANFKYGKLEATFLHEQMEELKETVKESKLPPSPVEEHKAVTSEDNSAEIIDQALRLATEYPEPAVITGWQAVEIELSSALERLSIVQDPSKITPMRKLYILHERGYIDPLMTDVLNQMRHLRNNLLHRGATTDKQPRMDSKMAHDFLSIAQRAIIQLKSMQIIS